MPPQTHFTEAGPSKVTPGWWDTGFDVDRRTAPRRRDGRGEIWRYRPVLEINTADALPVVLDCTRRH